MFEVISGSQFPTVVIPLIEKATKNIRVVVFDWRWYPQDPGASCQLFNQAIIRAARRGVKVAGIVNNDQIASIFKLNGCEFKKLITGKLVHCKLMIIDDVIAITGSHNYTQSAFQMNFELSVVLEGEDSIVKLVNFFNNLWQK